MRAQAIAHTVDCIAIGRQLGSRALTVWIADGSNFAGQSNLTLALDRYLDSMREIYAALPADWLDAVLTDNATEWFGLAAPAAA